jgi:hypothetical protein
MVIVVTPSLKVRYVLLPTSAAASPNGYSDFLDGVLLASGTPIRISI